MLNDPNFLLLLFLMPLASFLYASVGHGGASSYLMLLTLFHFAPEQIRPAALLLNIIVSGVAFMWYRKVSKFPLSLFLALVIFSVPASFWGGTIEIDSGNYKRMLGILLLFPVARLLNLLPMREASEYKNQWWVAAILGLSIGFLSGLIGIGGGIILSPVLLLLGWTTVKQTASVSALFIFLNSIAGFAGSGSFHIQFQTELYYLLPLTVAGGITGAWLGAHRFQVPVLKYLLAVVLLVAAIKFLFA